MIATTAKLRALLEAATTNSYSGNDARLALKNVAPDLARLVLTLAEAVEQFSAPAASASYVAGNPPIAKARKALAAVEELKL